MIAQGNDREIVYNSERVSPKGRRYPRPRYEKSGIVFRVVLRGCRVERERGEHREGRGTTKTNTSRLIDSTR